MTPEIAIFARWPEPGKAKTRLIPALGAEGAAQLYRTLLELTVREARGSGLPFHLRVTGGDPARFREWLGSDLDVRDQGGGDLGEKLTRVPTPGMMAATGCSACARPAPTCSSTWRGAQTRSSPRRCGGLRPGVSPRTCCPS